MLNGAADCELESSLSVGASTLTVRLFVRNSIRRFFYPLVAVALLSGTPAAAQDAGSEALIAQAVTVSLADAGAEPRQELRYNLAAMQPQQMRMDMTMRMTMSNPMFGEQTVDMPTMRMNMEMSEAAMNENGTLRLGFRFRGVEIIPTEGTDPGMVAAMQGAMAGMDNVTGYTVIDSRGHVIEADFDASGAPAAVQQQLGSMRDSLEQMVAPLPDEAVGIGARWSITTNVDANGASIQQTATYELLERTENAFRVSVTMVQSAEQQQIQDPSIPAGMSAWLESYSATGSGGAVIPLNSPVPTSNASINSNMSMAIDDGSGTRVPYMTMQLSMDMNIQPVAAE